MADEGTDLSVHIDRPGPYALVRLAGDVDIESSGELTETLKAVLATLGTAPLVIDLAEVEFMDSSGLGVLVGAHKEAEAQGGSLELVNPHPRVTKILRITKLHKVLTVRESLADATAANSDV
ncbi:anti-sigma B factor antagonist [Kribbella amoyensis]|uniref:Anti-sigma factor antagonist n=1 Tax=Kribbella amoyensis TaxID=996641 RepID=A0A561BLQ5_9ACTN|nr:STAS domain-containing protein [Kribbella amoyensis]TWD79757.1 anti-sigma B factor antagonist [Kribbella amoyensis]